MTESVFDSYGTMPVIYAGGVMADSIIKNSFTEKFSAIFAQPQFSTDNAAGIAYLTDRKLKNVQT